MSSGLACFVEAQDEPVAVFRPLNGLNNCQAAAVATSRDLETWEKQGPAFAEAQGGKFEDLWSKAGAIRSRWRLPATAGLSRISYSNKQCFGAFLGLAVCFLQHEKRGSTEKRQPRAADLPGRLPGTLAGHVHPGGSGPALGGFQLPGDYAGTARSYEDGILRCAPPAQSAPSDGGIFERLADGSRTLRL